MSETVSPVAVNLRSVWGRAYVRIVGANREPSWIFFEGLLPLLGIAVYVFIYQAFGARAIATLVADPTLSDTARAAAIAAAQANVNALVGFVVLGGTMTAFWMNVLWSMASQLYWEKEMGNLQLYMMAPMSRMSLLGGMALGGIFMTSVRAVTTLVAGVFVFGVSFQLTDPWMLMAVFFATLVALYGMGMMLASLYLLYGREAWNLSALLEEPVFLASGFYFPVRILGPAVAFAASIIPAALGLDALRQLLFPGFFGGQFWLLSVGLELTILLGLCVLFLVLARLSLGYMETLAKREGRLTSRHQ
ncbi:MAG: ABC transporter permease [Methanobacteriota archaeon]|nr:MAG: ABC transporter permease [Euryarchaeota archaeon]